MSWFTYVKDESEEPKYPYVRRYVSNFIPFDDLEIGSWLFCDIENININKYYDGTIGENGFNILEDNNSFIVVYEANNSQEVEDQFSQIVVSSLIHEDKLYFKTAIEHPSSAIINNRYAIYYKTPGIKNFVNDEIISFNDINIYNYRVNPSDSKTYSFSFVNSSLNWDNGLTDQPYAKVYGKFSGPNLRIYGDKSPNGGKFRIKFVALSELTEAEESVFLDWIVIDTYSDTIEEDFLLFEKEDFSLKDYSFELETLYENNIKSLGKTVKINYYEFTYNQFLKLEPESINPVVHGYSQVKGSV
jgi:hypothetical protein